MDIERRKKLINDTMPIGREVTASEVSEMMKGGEMLTPREVVAMFYVMVNITFSRKTSKTFKTEVVACDSDGPILDEKGNTIIGESTRRKEYRYWIRSE